MNADNQLVRVVLQHPGPQFVGILNMLCRGYLTIAIGYALAFIDGDPRS
jgi:hypothetical protein